MTNTFKITPPENVWTIQGVEHQGGIYTARLLNGLLNDGTERTQPECAALRKKAGRGELYTPTLPEVHSLANTLYKNRKGRFKEQVEEVREFIEDKARCNGIFTLTSVVYTPSGPDRLCHLPSERSIRINLVGKDELIRDTKNPKTYKALFGTSDSVSKISDVYHWLLGNELHMFRPNKREDEDFEVVAGILILFYGTSLYCDGNPARDASLGVSFTREK